MPLLEARRSRGIRLQSPAGIGRIKPAQALRTPTVIPAQAERTYDRVDIATVVFGLALQRPVAAGAHEGSGLRLRGGGLRQERNAQEVEFLDERDFQVPKTGAWRLGQTTQAPLGGGQPISKSFGSERWIAVDRIG